jgi:hypothetical protein
VSAFHKWTCASTIIAKPPDCRGGVCRGWAKPAMAWRSSADATVSDQDFVKWQP